MTIARLNEYWVLGTLKTACEGYISTVTWYLPEVEPDVSSAYAWGMLEMDFAETPDDRVSWSAEGKLTAHIHARRSANNMYTARLISQSLTGIFNKTASLPITSGGVKGYIKFQEPSSTALGTVDGIIMHRWEADFRVFSIT